jgi:hypothetical protein
LIRYIYGLPSCDDGDCDLDAVTLVRLSESGDKFGVPGLREHALSESEKRLKYLLEGVLAESEKGQPSKASLRSFVREVNNLCEELWIDCDLDSDGTDAMEVVVKTCCTHYSVLRQCKGFNDLYSELMRSMLQYTATSHGGDLLSKKTIPGNPELEYTSKGSLGFQADTSYRRRPPENSSAGK